jgi:hypothetical protein
MAAVVVGGPLAAIVSGALVGLGAVVPGLLAALVTLRVARGQMLSAAREWVRDRTPSASDSTFLGVSLACFSAVELASGIVARVLGAAADATMMVPAFVFFFLAFATGMLARGSLRSARLLRRVPGLLEPGEEARAVAIRSNGMCPARSLAMLVATDERLVWVDRDGERSFARSDVEGVEAEPVSGRLCVRLAGEVLEMSPVPRREMKQLRPLLAR